MCKLLFSSGLLVWRSHFRIGDGSMRFGLVIDVTVTCAEVGSGQKRYKMSNITTHVASHGLRSHCHHVIFQMLKKASFFSPILFVSLLSQVMHSSLAFVIVNILTWHGSRPSPRFWDARVCYVLLSRQVRLDDCHDDATGSQSNHIIIIIIIRRGETSLELKASRKSDIKMFISDPKLNPRRPSPTSFDGIKRSYVE